MGATLLSPFFFSSLTQPCAFFKFPKGNRSQNFSVYVMIRQKPPPEGVGPPSSWFQGDFPGSPEIPESPPAAGRLFSVISATQTKCKGTFQLFKNFRPCLSCYGEVLLHPNENNIWNSRFSLLHYLHAQLASLLAQWQVNNLPANAGDASSIPGQEDPLERKWQSTLVFLSGKSLGQRCLADYSPWGHKRVRPNLATKHHHHQQHTQCDTLCLTVCNSEEVWG